MINSKYPINISRQCQLLHVGRSSYYYQPQGETDFNQQLMNEIDQQFLKTPYYGVQQMVYHFNNLGYSIGVKRVRRLMRLMDLQAIYQSPKTSDPNPQHKIYPYLLRDMAIDKVNQVWCTDITYIRMKKGFLYLIAIMDWYSRKVLAWQLSNTMQNEFCVDTLNRALHQYDTPEIFNTDQGSQFTSNEFTGLLLSNNIKVSMDGKGAWRDNVFIERLWRSLKYECVYLHEFADGWEARDKISQWIEHYNSQRPHAFHKGLTPDTIFNLQRAA